MGIVCHSLHCPGCEMRGAETGQQVLFSYVAINARIPADHPLRAMKHLLEPVLAELAPRFATMYAEGGRPSIPPEQLLRALLLQVLYTVRSERQLIEQLEYNLLFRWFVGLGMDDTVWHATTFTKNRDRMVEGGVAEAFFAAVVRQADTRGLLSREHFTVDGTLLEAWASQKSVRRKGDDGSPPNGGGPVGRNTPANFHGERRSNATHQSVTDPEAQMARKGRGQAERAGLSGERHDRQPPWPGRRDGGRAGDGHGGSGAGRANAECLEPRTDRADGASDRRRG